MAEQLRKEKLNFAEENNNQSLTKEAFEIIEILDAIENHTAQLRKKILAEVSQDNNKIHLNLNKIED